MPKKIILLTFTHPHVISNIYDLLSSTEHKDDILTNVGLQTVLVPIDYYYGQKYNGTQWEPK